MELLLQPWPWYIAGPLIALTMFLLLYFGGNFGLSANLRTACAMTGAGKKVAFFQFDWKKQQWNLVFLLGAIIGGIISANLLSNGETISLNPATLVALKELGFEAPTANYLPERLFDLNALQSFYGLSLLLAGGFLVGFGARYAGGCTSGHAISGISNLQWPSLLAVVGFFIGGLVMTHLLFPLIF